MIGGWLTWKIKFAKILHYNKSMVRGALRGGRPMRGGIRPPFKKTFVPRHPFDLTLAEVVFPKVSPAVDDSALTAVKSISHI